MPTFPTRIRALTFATALLMAATPSLASMARPAATEWVGTWKDGKGGVVAVTESAGVLDIWGTDNLSIYRCSCVVDAKDPTAAACAGEGINHASGSRFLYRSQLKMSGDTLGETWQANFAEGEIKGQASFKRSSRPAAPASR